MTASECMTILFYLNFMLSKKTQSSLEILTKILKKMTNVRKKGPPPLIVYKDKSSLKVNEVGLKVGHFAEAGSSGVRGFKRATMSYSTCI